MRTIFKDKTFLKAMIAIALPITLQNLVASSVNMLDTLMITSLGEESLAAVGLANQVFFFLCRYHIWCSHGFISICVTILG